MADSVRIGAVMVVSGPDERFDLDVIEEGGWFSARVRGAFGRVEGWLQLRPETAGPQGYGQAVAEGKAGLCGISASGDSFVRDLTTEC